MRSIHRHFTHITNAEGEREAALVLGCGKRGYVMPMSLAWTCHHDLNRYDDPELIMKRAMVAARELGLEPVTRYQIAEIASMLEEGIEELLALPPEHPDEAPKPAAEGVVRVDGEEYEVGLN